MAAAAIFVSPGSNDLKEERVDCEEPLPLALVLKGFQTRKMKRNPEDGTVCFLLLRVSAVGAAGDSQRVGAVRVPESSPPELAADVLQTVEAGVSPEDAGPVVGQSGHAHRQRHQLPVGGRVDHLRQRAQV